MASLTRSQLAPRALPLLLLLLASLAFGAVTRAQQPFVTDDADVTDKGKFHFEFSNEYDRLQASSAPTVRQNTADFELDYGLFDGVEIGIESPHLTLVNAAGANPHAVAGLGDTNLSLKYNFRKERDGSRLPAMSVGFNLELPTGSVSRQLGSGLADFYLNGIAQKTLNERTKLRANGGVLFSGNQTTGVIGVRTRGTVFTGGASLVRQFTSKLDLGAELTGAVTGNFSLGKGQLQTLCGGNYTLRPNFTFDFGVVAGRFPASPRLGAQLGFSIDF